MQQENVDSIYQRLKAAREQAGVTLAQLAERTGYALATLSGVENGHDRPSKRLLGRWIDALQLDERWVEKGEGKVFRGTAAEPAPQKERNLAAPLRSRIRKARQYTMGLLEELDRMEEDLAQSHGDPRSRKVPDKPRNGAPG